MKSMLILLLSVFSLMAFNVTMGAKYTGWPEKDSTLDGVLILDPDTLKAADRLPIQVIFLVDISRECAGRVRQGLIEGGKKLIAGLKDTDRFGIVVYSEYARTLLPLGELTPERRSDALEQLERITTEEGRNLSLALDKVSQEFSLRQGEKIEGRYVVLSSLGPVLQGVTDSTLIDTIDAYAKHEKRPFDLVTVGHGNGFNEDLLIRAARENGGRAFFAPDLRPDSLVSIFENVTNEITKVAVKDIEIYLTYPENDVKICYFGTTTPLPNPIRLSQISEGEKYQLFYTIHNRPSKSFPLDYEVEYYSPTIKTRLSVTGGTKVRLASDPIYTAATAPSLIQYSILYRLSTNLEQFRRVDKEMEPNEAKEYRKNYASAFQTGVLNRLETVKNEINTPEINYTRELINSIHKEIRDGVVETEYLIRRVKYNLHQTEYGK